MGSDYRDSFVHDGRYVKAGRNFLELDSFDNVLICEVGNSNSKKFVVWALSEFKNKTGCFHKLEIVGKDDVDRFTEELEKFKKREAECDFHNMKEIKKRNISVALF